MLRKIKKILFIIALLLFLAIGLSFAILNASPVSIDYYLGNRQIALSLLLVYALGIGLLLGFLSGSLSRLRLKRANFQLKKALQQRETHFPISPSTP